MIDEQKKNWIAGHAHDAVYNSALVVFAGPHPDGSASVSMVTTPDKDMLEWSLAAEINRTDGLAAMLRSALKKAAMIRRLSKTTPKTPTL